MSNVKLNQCDVYRCCKTPITASASEVDCVCTEQVRFVTSKLSAMHPLLVPGCHSSFTLLHTASALSFCPLVTQACVLANPRLQTLGPAAVDAAVAAALCTDSRPPQHLTCQNRPVLLASSSFAIVLSCVARTFCKLCSSTSNLRRKAAGGPNR